VFSSGEGPPGAKPATQRRSQQSRDRLIDALDELLRERPFEAIHLTDIAGRAGSSVATVYQRFRNKDAAVAILVALYVRRSADWWRAFSADNAGQAAWPSLHEAVVAVGRAAWRQVEELGYLMRPAYLYSRLRTGLLDEHWRDQEQRAVRGFRELLDTYAGEIDHPDLDRAAGMIAYFVNMMFLGRLLHPAGMSGWNVPAGREAFAAELARFVCGYLWVAGRPEPEGER
jgi:AcrR family transcriptional regulator